MKVYNGNLGEGIPTGTTWLDFGSQGSLALLEFRGQNFAFFLRKENPFFLSVVLLKVTNYVNKYIVCCLFFIKQNPKHIMCVVLLLIPKAVA